jgi:hypothetical protein
LNSIDVTLCAISPSLVCNAAAGVQQQQRGKGRPRKKFPAAAYAAYVSHLNDGQLEDEPSYSSAKKVFKAKCSCSKHMRVMACQQVTRTKAALPCRKCEGGGSPYEKEAYAACDASTLITAWAAEAHAVQETVQHQGLDLYAGRHSYDILVLQPARVLVEVQGEQHSTKLNTQANNPDASLDDRVSRDHALAAAAKAAGYSVVWLHVGAQHTQVNRRQQWQGTIEAAVRYMMQENATPTEFNG